MESISSFINSASRVLDILNETFALFEEKKSVFFRLQFLKEVSTRVAFINLELNKSELSKED